MADKEKGSDSPNTHPVRHYPGSNKAFENASDVSAGPGFNRSKRDPTKPGFNFGPERNSGIASLHTLDQNTMDPHTSLRDGNGDINEGDENYWNQIQTLYANVLDASGINLRDPIHANIKYFNKTQKRMTVDPPMIGKTYVFVTRPDLNLSGDPGTSGYSNLKKNELFDYFSRMEIGHYIMPFLMFPNGYRTFRLSSEMDSQGRMNWGKKAHETPPKGTNYETSDYFLSKGAATDNLGGGCKRYPIGGWNPLQDDTNEREVTDSNGVKTRIKYDIFTPFIPYFSNLCVSTGGGKDMTLEDYETDGDYMGNKLVYPVGADETFSIGELPLTFKDIDGSPVMHTINLWANYIYYYNKGMVITRKEYLAEKILDYTCSIYVFVTARDHQTILGWAKYTGCYPSVIPYSAIAHNIEASPDALSDLQVSFRFNRYEPMKPSTLLDFNKLMAPFAVEAMTRDVKERSPMPEITPAIPTSAVPGWAKKEGAAVDESLHPPLTYANEAQTEMRPKEKKDYDKDFWGICPYVVDHKLVWI